MIAVEPMQVMPAPEEAEPVGDRYELTDRAANVDQRRHLAQFVPGVVDIERRAKGVVAKVAGAAADAARDERTLPGLDPVEQPCLLPGRPQPEQLRYREPAPANRQAGRRADHIGELRHAHHHQLLFLEPVGDDDPLRMLAVVRHPKLQRAEPVLLLRDRRRFEVVGPWRKRQAVRRRIAGHRSRVVILRQEAESFGSVERTLVEQAVQRQPDPRLKSAGRFCGFAAELPVRAELRQRKALRDHEFLPKPDIRTDVVKSQHVRLLRIC